MYCWIIKQLQGYSERERELLMNIREEDLPITVHGVGGSITVTEVEDTANFGRVVFSQIAIANILSFDEVASKYKMELIRKLRYPSIQYLVKLIKAGGILNCPVTIHDVYRA